MWNEKIECNVVGFPPQLTRKRGKRVYFKRKIDEANHEWVEPTRGGWGIAIMGRKRHVGPVFLELARKKVGVTVVLPLVSVATRYIYVGSVETFSWHIFRFSFRKTFSCGTSQRWAQLVRVCVFLRISWFYLIIHFTQMIRNVTVYI